MSKELQLGRLIEADREASRDAVHVAVAPGVAGEPLCRGDYVAIEDGLAVRQHATNAASRRKVVGVVDPFLQEECVPKGARFWIWLVPGSIKTLRHHWTHPAFPDEDRKSDVKNAEIELAWKTVEDWWSREAWDFPDDAESWKKRFLSIFNAAAGFTTSDDACLPFEVNGPVPPEIWAAYMTIVGKFVSNTDEIYFRCAC